MSDLLYINTRKVNLLLFPAVIMLYSSIIEQLQFGNRVWTTMHQIHKDDSQWLIQTSDFQIQNPFL